MEFHWNNKGNTLSISLFAGIDLGCWGGPFTVHSRCGKFNTDMTVDDKGRCVFNKIKSSGWFVEPLIRFLCFYFTLEFNRWYQND